MIRLGLDVHGVIDDDPEFFTSMAWYILKKKGQIYIITGREDCPDLHKELEELGMNSSLYDGILSITTHQIAQGTPISYLDDRKSQPVMEPKIWNPTKAALGASAGIDVMIDDSPIYGEFFRDIKTQYITYTPAVKEFLKILYYSGGYKL